MFRLFATILLLVPSIGSSAAVVDQMHLPVAPGNLPPATGVLSSTTDRSQTFTVGIDGVLSDFEALVSRTPGASGDLFWDIRTVATDGTPTEPDSGANILASGVISSAALPEAFNATDYFSFGPMAVDVSVGDRLAFVMRTDQGNYRVGYSTSDLYTRGDAYTRLAGNWMETRSISVEMGFRSFVAPSAIPEPNSAVVLAAICGGLCLVRGGRHVPPILP